MSKTAKAVALIGQPRIGSSVTFDNFLRLYDDINIIPSMGGQFSPDEDMPIIYSACTEQSELVNRLVSNVIPLADINGGFAEMKSPTSKRIIIEFPGATNE